MVMSTSDLIPVDLFGIKTEMLMDALELLDHTLGISTEHNLRLGGGTALAMLWHHRRSTDIDLAMPGEDLQEVLQSGFNRIRAELDRLRQQGEIRQVIVRRSGAIGWTWPDGEVSLSASWGHREPPKHMERASFLPLSPEIDILRGKLVGRVVGSGRLLARDGYDLCLASKKIPTVFNRLILDVLHGDESDELHTLITRVKTTPHRIIQGRPILEPSDPDLAHDPWGRFIEHVEQVIEGKNQSKGLEL